MAAAYQAGRSLRAIADILAVHHHTVAARLEQLRIPRRAHEPKMSDDDVRAASRRYAAGDSLAAVGATFHVDAATMQQNSGERAPFGRAV